MVARPLHLRLTFTLVIAAFGLLLAAPPGAPLEVAAPATAQGLQGGLGLQFFGECNQWHGSGTYCDVYAPHAWFYAY